MVKVRSAAYCSSTYLSALDLQGIDLRSLSYKHQADCDLVIKSAVVESKLPIRWCLQEKLLPRRERLHLILARSATFLIGCQPKSNQAQ